MDEVKIPVAEVRKLIKLFGHYQDQRAKMKKLYGANDGRLNGIIRSPI
jgi:hypothetical protein